MKTKPRKPTRRERELLAHVRQARARRMPLAQYCRAQGLSVQSLYNVRHQLARKNGRLQATTKKSKRARRFVAVQVVPTEPVPRSAACRLHLKGWVIECTSLPPTTWVTGLMSGEADAAS